MNLTSISRRNFLATGIALAAAPALKSEALTATALALRLLVSGRGTVGTAAERTGLSERQLERKSLECAGISPKSLSRISRFQHAIGRHRAGYGNWKEIAHGGGRIVVTLPRGWISDPRSGINSS
jgi:AraC-like DNA-binding protein